MEQNTKLIYEDLSYQIIGCAFEAFKAVGVGFDEINYHKVFHHYLMQKGLQIKYKPPVYLDYLGKRIGDFEIDEIVEDKIIIELKCIQTGFIPDNLAQIITYLKISNLRLGLLINFGLHKAFTKRVIFDLIRERNFEYWDAQFNSTVSIKATLESVITILKNIDRILGPGFHSKIYKSALDIELNQQKIASDKNVRINLEIENIRFNPVTIDFWLIEKFLLVAILAGSKKPRVYDIFRMRSFLKRLDLHHGLIAFWSEKNLQLFGIYQP